MEKRIARSMAALLLGIYRDAYGLQIKTPVLASMACRFLGHDYTSFGSVGSNTDGSWTMKKVCMRCMAIKREPYTTKRHNSPSIEASTLGHDAYAYGEQKPSTDFGPSRQRNEAAIAAMDDIERLRMYSHYLIDEAAWRATPCIYADGFKYLHTDSPRLTLAEFYGTPAFNTSFGSTACWYLEMYYTPPHA